jgi:hypothetical protein
MNRMILIKKNKLKYQLTLIIFFIYKKIKGNKNYYNLRGKKKKINISFHSIKNKKNPKIY